MKIFSKRFDTELEFDDKMILKLDWGLFGFPNSKRFCILELDADNAPFKWLHDVDNTNVALLITDPYQFFPQYNPKISEGIIQDLKIKDLQDELMLFTIVKVAKGGAEAFTNLRAPVVVNSTTKEARQIILESDEYSVKTMLFSRDLSAKAEAS